MSALSNELFFNVHRGLSQPSPVPIKKELGTHWTTEEGIAHELADRQRTGYDYHYNPEYRTVIHARAPISSVEHDVSTLEKGHVFSPTNLNKNIEKEVPIKKGAPLLVTGMTKRYSEPLVDADTGSVVENRKTRTRKRTFNPPREMRA